MGTPVSPAGHDLLPRQAAAGLTREELSLQLRPTAAHAQTKRIVRHALTHNSRSADRVVLDESTSLYDTLDMQNAVGRLLDQGARKFLANHHEIVFEGR